MSTTRLQLRKKDLNSARERLLAFQQENMEAEEFVKPIIIAKNVSLETYTKYCKAERKLPVKIRLIDGNIIAYEVTLADHGVVVCEISNLIYGWDDQLNGAFAEDLILESSYCTADLTIRPRDLPPPHPGHESNSSGAPYPTMVTEVGYIETVSSLHDLSTRYFSSRTTIQIYLVIKLFPIRQDHTRAMLAMRYLRTNQYPTAPDVVISFGTAPLHNKTIDFLLNNMGVPDANITGVGRFNAIACNGPRIPNYQLNIPAAELFNGTPNGIPPNAVGGFDLDLWKIQNAVLNLY
ncbi:6468_t:CDS:1 [Dentiscutata erythropus]|uniref:6468_t:CDS:1 n=1 Tax=Dentiscutata erythropus TaxID=1348616 RepID=A0A9N9J0L4_9GLOM|nr:6468_t:CDS:1 [Dentiscutata erythropus]